MERTETNGNWAVVVSGNRKYIGRDVIEDETEDSQYVTLNPCFEYFSEPMQTQSPQGRIEIVGRTKVILPFDHTMGPAQVTVFVTAICYVKHMAAEDRVNYEKMIEETCRNIEAQCVKRNSGIVIVGSLPPNGGTDALKRK